MALLEKLDDDLKTAMKSRDQLRVETIRLLRSQLKDAQIAKQEDLTPDEEVSILTSAAKRRREAIEAYEKGGRTDLRDQEAAELDIISEYLPKQMGREEIQELVDAAVQETGAAGMKDLGKVMGKIMPQVKGRADGKLVQEIVRERLS